MGMKKLKKAALAHIASSLTNVEFGFLGQLSGGIDQNKYGIIYMEELEKAVKGINKLALGVKNNVFILKIP